MDASGKYNGRLNKTNVFEVALSSYPIAWKYEEVNGRFILYPTTNNYNFIMLDQVNGKTYQVQWSQEPDKRIIVPIE